MTLAFKEFVAGWFGGCSSIVVGHPLDTIKARLQTQGVGGRAVRYSGATHCFLDILKTEGVRGLYKGMASPLLGVAGVTALAFGTHSSCLRLLQPDGGRPTAFNSMIAGMVAGTVQCIVCCPTELVKLRMQLMGIGVAEKPLTSLLHPKTPVMLLNTSSSAAVSSSSASITEHRALDTVKHILRTEGIKGLNKGMTVTVYREAPAYGVYFGLFDWTCQRLVKKGYVRELGPGVVCLTGGISGTAAWVVTYPLDVVKSRLQTDGINGNHQYNGIVDCARKSYTREGLKVFVRGLSTCLVRAFPVNVATFGTVAVLLKNWRH